MLFNSLQFIIFLPVVVILYYILPHKFRWILLLIASYYFYMIWNPKYIVLIIFSTLLNYTLSILMEKYFNLKKIFLSISLVTSLGLLFFFKYFNFTLHSIDFFTSSIFNIGTPNIYSNFLLPMGISFYTFQTLSYTIDVYKGNRTSEKHLGYFALFVIYFPQLVAGPIEKSENLLPTLRKKQTLKYSRIMESLLIIAFGFFKKVVIADRIAVIVNTVYNNLGYYNGIYLIIASLLFVVQIYCDFSGYSDIAVGSAKLMGHELMENFKYPYFSKSIKEFWSRWHISLSTWFRDYVYFPLGGNRKGIFRGYINLIIVFLISGLWHGANFTFIVWGLLNGLYQVIEKLYWNISKKFKLLKNLNSQVPDIFKNLYTFILIVIAFIFFRAETVSDAIYVIKNSFTNNIYAIFDGSVYSLGLEYKDFNIGILCILFLFFTEYIKYTFEKDSLIKNSFEKGLAAIIIFMFVLIFGFYGEYDTSSFIYFQF